MEDDVQTPAPDEADRGTSALGQTGAGPDDPVLAVLDDPPREQEEMRLLLVGFATGLAIGGIFLIYIVLATARLLT